MVGMITAQKKGLEELIDFVLGGNDCLDFFFAATRDCTVIGFNVKG
jgi:hypothetical protein